MADEKPTRLLPPTYMLASIVLMWVLHHYFPLRRIIWPPWTRLGGILILLGFAVVVLCTAKFRKRQTTIRPFEESTALIEGGLYRYSRNPIYVGMVVMLAGVAWVMGTVTPWVIVPLFAVVLSQQFIAYEELALARKFGDRYEQYCRRVRRWL